MRTATLIAACVLALAQSALGQSAPRDRNTRYPDNSHIRRRPHSYIRTSPSESNNCFERLRAAASTAHGA
jgi:hypothetical protein